VTDDGFAAQIEQGLSGKATGTESGWDYGNRRRHEIPANADSGFFANSAGTPGGSLPGIPVAQPRHDANPVERKKQPPEKDPATPRAGAPRKRLLFVDAGKPPRLRRSGRAGQGMAAPFRTCDASGCPLEGTGI